MARHTTIRSLHDIGLAAWFGGSLMGAVGLNGAASAVDDPRQRGRVANAGWDRWTPVNAAAIGAHLVGGAGILATDSHRLKGQKGVFAASALKAGLTAGALGATAYSRALGRKLSQAGDVPAESGAQPHATTPPALASAQRQLGALQWAIPGLTGAMLVLNAYQGEQQRPSEVVSGFFGRAAQAVRAA